MDSRFTSHSQLYIHWKQWQQLQYSVSFISVFWREEASAPRINMECEKRNKYNRDLQVSWAIYSREWIFWSLCRRTNYTQVTAELGVTLSNFYPIVCVHTSWLSYQYVCAFVWQGKGVCDDGMCVYLCICFSRELTVSVLVWVCVSLCEGVGWWEGACAGLLGTESIKAAGSQLASGLICSSVAVNYSQCLVGCSNGV